jgi:hypothetical protein
MKNASTAADLLLPQLEPFPLHNKKQQQKNQKQQQQKRKQVKPPRQQQSKIQKKQCEKPQKRGNTNPKGVANSTHQENVNRRRSDGDHLRNQSLLDASDQMEVDHSSDDHYLHQDDPKVDDVQIPDDDAYTNPYASAVQNLLQQVGMPGFPLPQWQLPPLLPNNNQAAEQITRTDGPVIRRSSRPTTRVGEPRQQMRK